MNEEFARYSDLWMATLPISRRTRGMYASDIKKFLSWANDLGIDCLHASHTDLLAYKSWLRNQTESAHSIERWIRVLVRFYEWLEATGHVLGNPASGLTTDPRPSVATSHLSLEELRAIWASCVRTTDRAIVGLLTICCLTSDELCRADIGHLISRDGRRVLRMPRRRPAVAEAKYVALPTSVAEAIDMCVDGRTVGPLILNRNGQRLTTLNVRRVARRLAMAAGVKRTVDLRMMTNTGRWLAVEHGFSFASVMLSLPSHDGRHLEPYLKAVHVSLDRHPSYRLERLVAVRTTEADRVLSEAEALLHETESPPAAAVGLAGAALESHLRALALSTGLTVDDAGLGTYGGLLCGKKIFTPTDVQLLTPLQDMRNDAAHGHFDRIDTTKAQRFITEARRYVRDYPLR